MLIGSFWINSLPPNKLENIKKVERFNQLFLNQVEINDVEISSNKIRVEIVFHVNKEHINIEHMSKIVLDAINKVIVFDNSQIYELIVNKVMNGFKHTFVSIYELDDIDDIEKD